MFSISLKQNANTKYGHYMKKLLAYYAPLEESEKHAQANAHASTAGTNLS